MRLRQHHCELFAADARYPILTESQSVDDAVGKLTQHFIADGVSVGVIDLLEMIDVARDERERMAQAYRACDFARELVLEETPTATASELVDRGENSIVGQRELQRLGEAHD